MKTALILVNEDFMEMRVGVNASLAFIVACHEIGLRVLICKARKDGFFDEKINAIEPSNSSLEKVCQEYKTQNQKFLDDSSPKKTLLVKELFDANSLDAKIFEASEIDFVINRLEPMKPPFLPHGNLDPKKYIHGLEKIFGAHKIFNLQRETYGDKELPLVDELKKIATPTLICDLDSLAQKIKEARKNFGASFFAICLRQIANFTLHGQRPALRGPRNYPLRDNCQNFRKKLIVKPQDSAQSLGVFSLEIANSFFSEKTLFKFPFTANFGKILRKKESKNSDLSLKKLRAKKLSEINSSQSFKVAIDKDLEEILKIICFAFAAKFEGFDDKKICEFDDEEIATYNKKLYGRKILIQPFIEGVARGDIRVNLMKIDGEFKTSGIVFRKSFGDSENFTTTLSSGQSRAYPVEGEFGLSQNEQNDLVKKILVFLKFINSDVMKARYLGVYELGLDFLLSEKEENKENGEVILGEVNHWCVALQPLSEAMQKTISDNLVKKINGGDFAYDGGIGAIKKTLKSFVESLD